MTGDPEDLMSRKDIARRVKVHQKTVARWDRQGRLPEATFRVGKVKRWHRAIIELWIHRGGAGPVAGDDETPPKPPRPPKKNPPSEGDKPALTGAEGSLREQMGAQGEQPVEEPKKRGRNPGG